MRKKLVATVMAAALTAVTLAGCGGGSGSPDSSSGTGSSGTESSGSATDSAGSTDNSGGGGTAAAEGITTEVGTPRAETLIVECQNSTDTPGQFNSYMQGTAMGFGIHQMMSAHLWEMSTAKGEQSGR